MTDIEVEAVVRAIVAQRVQISLYEQAIFVATLEADCPPLTNATLAKCGPNSAWWSQWIDVAGVLACGRNAEEGAKVIERAHLLVVDHAKRALPDPHKRTLVAIRDAIETRESVH